MGGPSLAVTGQALIHGPTDLSAPGVEAVREAFRSADVALANLEATVAVPGAWPTKRKTLHLTAADGLSGLGALGLGLLGHANNHAFDLGPPGIEATRRAAEAAGLGLAGSGATLAEARAAAVRSGPAGTVALLAADLGPQPDIVYAGERTAGIAPLRVERRVGVPGETFEALRVLVDRLGDEARRRARAAVGYEAAGEAGRLEVFGTAVEALAEGYADRRVPLADDLAALEAAVAEHASRGARVVVMLHSHHWDPDWSHAPGWWLDLARGLIDRGADLVAGHGAPVLQQIAFHRGRPILPGLGNVIFHTHRAPRYDSERPEVWQGVVVLAEYDAGGEARLRLLPVAAGRPEAPEGGLPPGPRPLAGPEAEAVFRRLTAGLDGADRGRVARAYRASA